MEGKPESITRRGDTEKDRMKEDYDYLINAPSLL